MRFRVPRTQSARFRDLRKMGKVTQADLAETFGVSQAYVSAVEGMNDGRDIPTEWWSHCRLCAGMPEPTKKD